MKIVMVIGSDAPKPNAKLAVHADWIGYAAYYEPSYCGCPDCHCITGRGKTEQEAIDDYWEQWHDRYGDNSPEGGKDGSKETR